MWRWVLLLLVQNVKGSDPGGYSRPGPRPAGVPPRQPPTTSPTQPPSNYAASAFTTYGSIGDALPEALFTHGRDRPKSDTPGGIADLMNLLESLEVVHPPSVSATENTHGSASLDGVAMKSKRPGNPRFISLISSQIHGPLFWRRISRSPTYWGLSHPISISVAQVSQFYPIVICCPCSMLRNTVFGFKQYHQLSVQFTIWHVQG